MGSNAVLFTLVIPMLEQPLREGLPYYLSPFKPKQLVADDQGVLICSIEGSIL